METSSEEREMEVEALQSIYGEQFSTGVGSEIDENVFYQVKLRQSDIKIIFTIAGNVKVLQWRYRLRNLSRILLLYSKNVWVGVSFVNPLG